MPQAHDAVTVPSWRARAALALGLLTAFYGCTLTLALLLFATAPTLAWLAVKHEKARFDTGYLLLFAVTWIPAIFLMRGVFVRPPRPASSPDRRPLARSEAPALFALVDELAAAARTTGPAEIVLVAEATASVTERGGLLGFGSKRALFLGLPLLALLDVTELRAVLAHEIGHYLGGDTRTSGVVRYTHALFVSLVTDMPFLRSRNLYVALGQSAARALGTALARLYARLYLRLTRRMDRQLELAADAFAASITSASALARALEKTAVGQPLFEMYMKTSVAFAVDHGALPSDLLPGFAWSMQRYTERGTTAGLMTAILDTAPDPHDTHPPLRERLERLGGPIVPAAPAASALDLLAFDHARWLADVVHVEFAVNVPFAPWAAIPAHFLAPSHVARARALADRLRSIDPAPRFASIFGLVAQGRAYEVARAVEPELVRLPQLQVTALVPQIVIAALSLLFTGALLERGASFVAILGEESPLLQLEGTSVAPRALVRAAFGEDAAVAALGAWAARLG